MDVIYCDIPFMMVWAPRDGKMLIRSLMLTRVPGLEQINI